MQAVFMICPFNGSQVSVVIGHDNQLADRCVESIYQQT
jgi:hypothetical protein